MTMAAILIIINKNISSERQKEAVLHELTHIEGNDFSREIQADLLEKMIRAQKQNTVDLLEFEFFYCLKISEILSQAW